MNTVKYQQIRPNDTTVDDAYQRELDERRAQVIAETFDPAIFGVPVLSRRNDGTLVRIDGQHRIHGAVTAGHGDETFLMEVHEGLSLKEEAALFLRLNGSRKGVGAIDRFKARLVAREPVAVEIQSVLKSVGCKIVRSQQRYGIQAIEAAEAAYHRGNLAETVRVLATWLDGDPQAFDKTFIRAVSAFLAAFPEAQPLHLASKLTKHHASKIRTRLDREKEAIGSAVEAARYVLLDVYNAGTPKAKRLVRATPEAEANGTTG